MRFASALCAAAFALAPAMALADVDEKPFPLLSDRTSELAPPEALGAGYFNGIGSEGRTWEAQSDTALDSKRSVYTQRFELARAFLLRSEVHLVARIDFGADAATATGIYTIQGPSLSLGLSVRSKSESYGLETGLRLILPWNSPNDLNPDALQLALGASVASSLADDARWLPFDRTGLQFYGSIRSRTAPFQIGGATFLVGAFYGGQASIVPMEVRSWLGPQTGFIGNAFLELFADVPAINIQVGAHADVSLSSIWPGADPFPGAVNGYLAWSPKYWFALRLFTGIAGSPSSTELSPSYPFGVRLQFFAP